MPQYSGNLIRNPGDSDLAGNYRRVQTRSSNFGTRKLQLYTVTVYGLSNNFIFNVLEPSAAEARRIDYDGSIDQGYTREYYRASILEAIIRGVQTMSEVHLVGAYNWIDENPDYYDLSLTIAVSADTVESGWEQAIRHGFQYNPQSERMLDQVVRAVDDYAPQDGYDGIGVAPVEISGDALQQYGAPIALGQYTDAQRAAYQERKAAIVANMPNPPQGHRPG